MMEEHRTQARWRRIVLMLGLPTFLLLMIFLAFNQFVKKPADIAARRTASWVTATALQDRLTSSHWQSTLNDLLETQFDLALLLSAAQVEEDPNLYAQNSLLQTLQANPLLEQYLHGHGKAISSVTFSPDGNLLASASRDKTIRLWDVESRQSVGTPLSGHTAAVTSLAFSSDGHLLASGGEDQVIRLWNVDSGQLVETAFVGHSADVTSVAFSPDGSLLASGGADGTVRLWDVASGQPVGEPIDRHTDIVTSVAFSPDGSLLASGSEDRTACVWDVESGQLVGEPLVAHLDGVTIVAFSPDGSLLASGSRDRTVNLWDVESRQAVKGLAWEGGEGVTGLAFSPDGELLAVANKNGMIQIWQPAIGFPAGRPLPGHTGGVTSVAFSPDGHTLASGSEDTTLLLWDLESLIQSLVPAVTGDSERMARVAFSPNGQWLASWGHDQTMRVWDLANGQIVAEFLDGDIENTISPVLAFSSDSSLLAWNNEAAVYLWDMMHKQMIGDPLLAAYRVHSLVFSPNGTLLASGDGEGNIQFWEVKTGKLLDELAGKQADPYMRNGVSSLAFSPDGSLLAAAYYEGYIQFWNMEKKERFGKPINVTTREHYVTSMTFSPDGSFLAWGNYGADVRLWNITRGQYEKVLNDFGESVTFSSDGRFLASGGWDGLHVWDLEVGQMLATLQSNNRVWVLGAPVPGIFPVSNFDEIGTLAFSPDGKTAVSAARDHTVRRWDLDVESWKNKACQRAGRNLTQAEWQLYFPERPYEVTCPQWPEGE